MSNLYDKYNVINFTLFVSYTKCRQNSFLCDINDTGCFAFKYGTILHLKGLVHYLLFYKSSCNSFAPSPRSYIYHHIKAFDKERLKVKSSMYQIYSNPLNLKLNTNLGRKKCLTGKRFFKIATFDRQVQPILYRAFKISIAACCLQLKVIIF